MQTALMIVAVGLAGASAAALAANDTGTSPLQGDYMVYGGELGDQQPATERDTKISFWVKGALARHMFDAMGAVATVQDGCGEEESDSVRRIRGDVQCTREKSGATECNFGIDMRSGKSRNGQIC